MLTSGTVSAKGISDDELASTTTDPDLLDPSMPFDSKPKQIDRPLVNKTQVQMDPAVTCATLRVLSEKTTNGAEEMARLFALSALTPGTEETGSPSCPLELLPQQKSRRLSKEAQACDLK